MPPKRLLVLLNDLAKNQERLRLLTRHAEAASVEIITAELSKFEFAYDGQRLRFGFRGAEVSDISSCLVLGKQGYQDEFDWAEFCLRTSGLKVHGSTRRSFPLSTKVGDALTFAALRLPQLPVAFSSREFMREVFDTWSRRYGLPVVGKVNGLTGRGSGVALLNTHSDLTRLTSAFPTSHILLQAYHPSAEDFRLWVVGDKVVSCTRRDKPAGEFRSNYRFGSSSESAVVPDAVHRQAESIADAIGSNVVAIDLIMDGDQPYFLETNVSANFAVSTDADMIARRLLSICVYHRVEPPEYEPVIFSLARTVFSPE